VSNQFYEYLSRLNEYERKRKLKGTLGIDLTEFEKNWATYSAEFQFPYNKLELDEGNSLVNIKLKDYKNIIFFVDLLSFQEEKILKSITMVASGDGTPQSGANIFIAMGILIASLNPNENIEFRKKIFSELGISELKMGTKSETIVNKFSYRLSTSKEIGVMFSVSL
jgi:hypothetical protein